MTVIKIKEIPLKEEQFVLYVDRKPGSVYGALTLQRVIDGKPAKLFERLPFASGQYPYTDGGDEDWVTGKGPIPFTSPGENYWLSTRKEPLQMEPVGTPFYCFSSKKGERVIYGPNGKQRADAGLHLENRFPGSAGCVVLMHDTPERERLAWLLFAELDRLHKAGINHIKTVVL